jgi:hypothetical protein
MSQDEALLDSGLGARKSYVLWQARNGQLCSSFAVMEGLRPAKPYESRVCNCFVFSTEIATFDPVMSLANGVRLIAFAAIACGPYS